MSAKNNVRVLTGITTTGTPHLGNYVGAIKPAIQLSKKFKSYLFLADYHSLIKVNDPDAVKESSHEDSCDMVSMRA